MPEEIAAAYVYVDTALGALNRRNHVQRLGDINFKDQSAERYISHRRGTTALLEWTRSHTNAHGQPTIEGFDGPVWDPSLPFDFDHRTDPGMAQYWVQQFLERLRQADVPLDALRFYYSGFKGFHVEIPHTLFGGFEPSEELHVHEKAAALELMAGIPFDTAVYDKLRLWRLPNTLNFKGQRYKVQLSLQEISTLSIREIADYLAVEPRPRQPTAPDEDWSPNEFLVEVWRRARGGSARPQPVEAPTPIWSGSRHDDIMLAGMVAAMARSWPADPSVSRHSDFLLPLSGYLARHMDGPTVAALLKEVARASGDRGFLDDRTRHWEDEIDRLATDSAAKIAAGQQVEGLPTIAKRWPELAEFLGNNFILPSTTTAPRERRAKPEAKGFEFTSVSDLLAEPPELVAYLTEGMLPMGGVSLWGAKPKTGKSVGVRNLCVCVAHGESFLGRACHQGTVLVLALEEKRAEVANHLRSLGADGASIHVHVGAAPLNSKDGLAALENAIVLYQPVLVIADPILKLVRVKDSSDYAELTLALEPVIELARLHNCHFAFTHHLGKQLRDGGDDVLGSTAIFGAVDTLVILRRRKDNSRVLLTIQRYGTDMPETLVPMDEAGRIVLGTALSEVRQAEAKEKVAEVLGKLGEGETLPTKDIKEKAEVDTGLVNHALKELLDEGLIARYGGGKRGDAYRYSLADRGPEKVVLWFSTTSTGKPENQKTETDFEIGGAAEPESGAEDHIEVTKTTNEPVDDGLCPVHKLAFDAHDCDQL